MTNKTFQMSFRLALRRTMTLDDLGGRRAAISSNCLGISRHFEDLGGNDGYKNVSDSTVC